MKFLGLEFKYELYTNEEGKTRTFEFKEGLDLIINVSKIISIDFENDLIELDYSGKVRTFGVEEWAMQKLFEELDVI